MRKDPHQLDLVAHVQASFQGKKARKHAERLKLLQSSEFSQQYYDNVLAVSILPGVPWSQSCQRSARSRAMQQGACEAA